MKKPQWITLGIAALLVIGLFAATQNNLFGERKKHPVVTNISPVEASGWGTDSILYYAKKNLPQAQITHLTQLENSIVRGDVAEQKLHLMHQLGRYWADSAKAYTALAD